MHRPFDIILILQEDLILEKLAIFDVDYTITKRETLIEFYRFMIKKNPKLLLHIPKIIGSGILYASKYYDLKGAKEQFLAFTVGIREDDMKQLVKEFYEKKLSKILYRDAIETIKKFKAEGFKIYLISASAEIYLNELYCIKEVDKVIGTRLIIKDGKYVKGFEGENNKGEEKVKRLLQDLKKDNIEVDFKASYMFSDSMADLPLFKLVGHPYLINYRKKTGEIEVLNWK